MTQLKVAAFTSICEVDVGLWADQYLQEVDRLEMPFAILFDRCSYESKQKFLRHKLCIGAEAQDHLGREYTEDLKQKSLDIVVKAGFEWALVWDSDETYSRNLPEFLEKELSGITTDKVSSCIVDTVIFQWVSLWGDKDHVRTDEGFLAHDRDKLYNLQGGRVWEFRGPVIYGPYLKGKKGGQSHYWANVTCLNHGMMTEELRKMHKERWDRVYGKAMGKNPHSLWDHALRPFDPATIVKHNYYD